MWMKRHVLNPACGANITVEARPSHVVIAGLVEIELCAQSCATVNSAKDAAELTSSAAHHGIEPSRYSTAEASHVAQDPRNNISVGSAISGVATPGSGIVRMLSAGLAERLDMVSSLAMN